MKFYPVVVMILVFLTGCVKSVKTVDYMVSARPMENRKYKVVEDVDGLSSTFRLLFVFQMNEKPSQSKALEAMLKKEGIDNVIEISCLKETVIVPVGSVEAYIVRGKAVKYEE